jgi:ABC-type phosphate transport system substrate-binding protein
MRTVAAIMVTTGLALLAAACGGSSDSHIARLGSTAAQSSPSSAGSGGSSNAGGSTHADALRQNMSPAQHAQLAREYLRFASCARSHGLSDFPDPITGSGGHPGFYFSGGKGSDLNPNNPAFQRGVETCQRILGHQFRFAFKPGGQGKGA